MCCLLQVTAETKPIFAYKRVAKQACTLYQDLNM